MLEARLLDIVLGCVVGIRRRRLPAQPAVSQGRFEADQTGVSDADRALIVEAV